jgi:hypothetical protein
LDRAAGTAREANVGALSRRIARNAFSFAENGALNAFSAMVSYRPAKRVEAYGGFLWARVTGGLASGYLYAPAVGLRVDF